MTEQKPDIFDKLMHLPVLNIFEPFYKKHKEVLMYLFFGFLTFVLSILTFVFFNKTCGINELVANVISWIICVMFAFLTNRTWVFNAETEGRSAFLKQMVNFYAGRLLTLILEEAILGIFITWLGFDSVAVKIVAQVVVIITNYIISKLWVFKKKGPAAASSVPTFFTIVSDKHSSYEYCEYKIKWNVERIIDAFYTAHAKLTKVLNGYIVQLVHFKYVDGRAANYYEAWEVTNGKTVSDGYDYDDNFSNGLPYGHDEDVPQHGVVSWKTKVYWVPEGIDVYDVVNNWKKKNVPEANELKAELEEEVSQDIKDQIEQNYVFSREYEHKW